MTSFETSLRSKTIFRKTLSRIYNILLDTEDTDDKARVKWQQDVCRVIDIDDWFATHKNIKIIALRKLF